MEAKHINSKLNQLIPIADDLSELEVSFYGHISAGFPSEAYNYMEEGIDFNRLLVKQKETTFCLMASGDCLTGDGIEDGDLLIVDRLAEPYDNSLLVFSIDGEFTLKRLHYGIGFIELVASNPRFENIILREGEILRRWAVLTFVIKQFYPNHVRFSGL